MRRIVEFPAWWPFLRSAFESVISFNYLPIPVHAIMAKGHIVACISCFVHFVIWGTRGYSCQLLAMISLVDSSDCCHEVTLIRFDIFHYTIFSPQHYPLVHGRRNCPHPMDPL